MYDRLVTEGHDARLLRFSPSADGTIPGSHQNPKNYNYWQVVVLALLKVSKAITLTPNYFRYRGSPDSTNFGLPGNHTIEKSY